MTTGWIDIKNTDMMLIMGGNPAENHPCGFKWPVEAKKTRDATFIEKDKDGYTVNRLETIGWIGGCTDTNELNFLAVKTMRSMGLCYFETQARV